MRLLLVAAGGLAREAAETARAGGHEVVAALDDDAARWGTAVAGVRIVGGIDAVADHPDTGLLLCAGQGAVRAGLVARLAQLGVARERYATVVDPAVRVPASCRIGVGCILLAGVVLTADVSLGDHVVVMPNVVLTHDDRLADFVTVAAGAVLGGSVRVGTRSYLGMASSVRERLRIGSDAVVGMGAVVLADVPDGEVWAGVPARRLHPAPQPVGVGS